MKHNSKGLSSFVSSWVPRVLSLLVAILIFAAVRYFNMASRVVSIPLDVSLPSAAHVEPESLVPASVADFSDVDNPGIARRAVVLTYAQDVFKDTALTVKTDPDVVRILFKDSNA